MMSEGSSLSVAEWLQTIKLDQYSDLFERHDLHTVADLRHFSDESLSVIGVILPGHRKRMLASLQKSISQDQSVEDEVIRPVPMKRNVFHKSAFERSTPSPKFDPIHSLEPLEKAKNICSPPPIPPRCGHGPPLKFSISPPKSVSPVSPPEPLAIDGPCNPTNTAISPLDECGRLEDDEEKIPKLVAPPLPAKRHKSERKTVRRSPPPLPARPPLTVPPKPSSPPLVPEEPRLTEDQQNFSSFAAPKPLPRIFPRDPPPTLIQPAHRDGLQKTELMDRIPGNIYEFHKDIDEIALIGFRQLNVSSSPIDNDVMENGSDNDYQTIDEDLSAWRSSSSLASGISSSNSFSGNMDDGESSTQQSSVIKAGWLDKNPPQGSYIFQRRWVKLDADFLRYYDSEKDMYSKRIIKTSLITKVASTGDQKFEVTTSNRNFVFRAESDAERNDWLKAFQQVVEDRRSRVSSTFQVSENVDKCGLLEMKGCKPKLFVVVATDKVYLYKNSEDFVSGVGVTSIEMNLGNVKVVDKRSFDLTTPYKTFSFIADSDQERDEWVEAMMQSVSEALSNFEVANRIWTVEANRRCADCDVPNPDWASVNLCVVICKKCAGEHRSLGPSVSKVRSLKMDNKVWTEELIQLFLNLGNEVSNKFWAANIPPSEAIECWSSSAERKSHITAKYREGKYRRYHQLFGNQTELNKALCVAVTTSDLTETQALVFCGADINCSSAEVFFSQPLELAHQAGQTLQEEFLRQNRTSEIPRLDPGIISQEYYVMHHSITHNGYLYKTSSMTKLVTNRKAKEEIPKKSIDPKAEDHIFQMEATSLDDNWSMVSRMDPDCSSNDRTKDSPAASRKGQMAIRYFSRRWCVLNEGTLSYYENNHSSTPNGVIRMDEIVCVAVIPQDTHGYESTFEIYTKSERLYLFAADTPEEAKEWVKSITKCFIPLKAEELLSYDFDRIGRLQSKAGRSLERATVGWFSLCKTNVYTYVEDNDIVEVINLKKLSELSMKGNELVLVGKGRITYILEERKLDFSGWVGAIQKASSTSGDTLSEQHLTNSDVPCLVEKCIDHISRFGVESDGIYRKSGQSSKTTTLLEALKKDARSMVLKEDDHVDNVSDALKRFFRGIGEGIFAEHCMQWLHVRGSDDERIQMYQELLQILPPVNMATLKALTGHLHNIQHFSNINKMNVHNLSIVFGPTLFQMDGGNNKPAQVVEDLIVYYQPIFNVDSQEIQKQLDVIAAIIKVGKDKQGKSRGCDFICPVYLMEKKADCEQSVHIAVTMTAQELTETLLERRNIRVRDGDYWNCFEVDDSEELERPLHFSEKVLPIFHSRDTNSSHLVVKKDLQMDGMLHYIKTRGGDSKNGMMKFREEKLLGFSFRDRYFMLNSSALRMYKEVRNMKEQSLSWDSVSETNKPEREWPVKSLTVYLGIKKKFRPQKGSFGFTIMCQNERNEKSQWYLCCDTERDMTEWFAAFMFVQYGSLWPEQTAAARTRNSHLDSTFGNRSLIPIRGSEMDIRRSMAAFTTDALTECH